jgi:hypothetical protein
MSTQKLYAPACLRVKAIVFSENLNLKFFMRLHLKHYHKLIIISFTRALFFNRACVNTLYDFLYRTIAGLVF